MESPTIDLNRSNKQRLGHETISFHIKEIERIYSESNIHINNSSQLFSLLGDAKDMATYWAEGSTSRADMTKLFNLLHIDRIYSGINLLDSQKNKEKYLIDLLKGTLDFFCREISHAKSIFWELEAYTKIEKVIPDAFLNEPDIVVNISGYNIAIPCKKIFSERGVPKVLSEAVSQIETKHEFGIVAINIDDLTPEDVVLKSKTFLDASNKLHDHNMDFLKRHERHFLKYLSANRIVAVIASTSMIAEFLDESPRFNNVSQWTIWTIPRLKPDHQKAIDEFRYKIIG